MVLTRHDDHTTLSTGPGFYSSFQNRILWERNLWDGNCCNLWSWVMHRRPSNLNVHSMSDSLFLNMDCEEFCSNNFNFSGIYWCKNAIYQKGIVIISIKSFDRFLSIRSITYELSFRNRIFVFLIRSSGNEETTLFNACASCLDAWKKVFALKLFSIEIIDRAINMAS